MKPKHIFRATYWHLSSMAEAVEGDAGITRHIAQFAAEDKAMFAAMIHDRYLADVDASVWVGPITDKGPAWS